MSSCQSSLGLVSLPQLLSLSPSSGQSDEGGWGSQGRPGGREKRAGGANISARAARFSMADMTAQPRFTKSPKRFPSFWEAQGGGRSEAAHPPNTKKKNPYGFQKNLDFFPVSLLRLNPNLPNFLRIYQNSCGFTKFPAAFLDLAGNLVNSQGGGRGGHVGHLMHECA